MSPSPLSRHQVICARLFRLLDDECPEGLMVLFAPLDVALEELSAWELRDGRYQAVAAIAGDEEWTSTSPYDVTVVPSRLAR